MSPEIRARLRCPKCCGGLGESSESDLVCTNPECAARFPVLDGVPVLIDEDSSVFTIEDFLSRRETYFRQHGPFERFVRSLIPGTSRNIKGAANYERLGELLLGASDSPVVLVLGGSILGEGMESLAERDGIDLVETDVALGGRTMLVCDAHDIPFEDGSFDGVVAQAVLEHVANPYRCCEEIHRVLKRRGIVYAETPFMQQVHGAPYDFTRFTYAGHRRLFRRFEEIDSGAVCGPGMALAWSYRYFLLSFVRSRWMKGIVTTFANLTSFYLKYFDPWLIDKPGASKAASAYYFLGRRADRALSDREIVRLFEGRS